MSREPRRNRELQDYTERFGRQSEGRLSRADERLFAEQADDRDTERAHARVAALLGTTRQVAARFRTLREGLHQPEARTSRYARNLARRIDHDLDALARELEKTEP